jgi:hypothetical protein
LQQVIEEMSMKGYEELKLTVSPSHLIEIDKALEDDEIVNKLTASKIANLVEVEEQTRLDTDGFYTPLAETSVTSASGVVLGYQAFVEDDGYLLGVMGPYEGRDGSWYGCADRPTDCFQAGLEAPQRSPKDDRAQAAHAETADPRPRGASAHGPDRACSGRVDSNCVGGHHKAKPDCRPLGKTGT